MSLTKSSIVRGFKSLQQFLETDQSTQKLIKIQKIIKSRRENQKRSRVRLQTGVIQKRASKKLEDVCKSQNIHKVPLQQLYIKYKTNPTKGLTSKQAERRLQEQGFNQITDKDGTPWPILFLKQMSDPFSIFVWVLVVLSFIGFGFNSNDTNYLYLSLILIITVVSGAVISYSFNRSSQGAIDSLKQFLPQYSTVIRDQKIQNIKTQKLVKGDIVIIQPGEKIPADIRIIDSKGMKLNNSTFTGQSILSKVSIEDSTAQNILNSKNMAFSGTVSQEGSGIGVVIQTGNNTLVSKIAEQILQVEEKPTSLDNQIARYVIIMTIWALFMGFLVFFVGMINGFRPHIAAMIGIGVCCASVPGVLNLVVTIIKTMAVRRLAKANMITKSLKTMQPFGSISVLCTDKTGTLTLNKMAVSSIFYDGKIHAAANKQQKGMDFIYQYDVQDPTFIQLHRCAILSSVAKFNKAPPRNQLMSIGSNRQLSINQKQLKQKQLKQNYQKQYQKMKYKQRPVLGDPQETALIRFFQPIQDIQKLKEHFPIVKNNKTKIQMILPFTSQRKYSMALVQNSQNAILNDQIADNIIIYTKGAPQTIFDMCSSVMMNGEIVKKSDQFKQTFQSTVSAFSNKGQRILALAMKILPKQKKKYQIKLDPPNFSTYNQTLLGIISLNDPPKHNIRNMIQKIRAAGIKVIMMTGDSVATATTIARQCNIITSQKTVNQYMKQRDMQMGQAINFSRSIVVHGDQLMKMNIQEQGLIGSFSGKKLQRVLEMQQIVFARISPYQKYKLVQTLQKQGHIVAVTGDGVNDSPAIKLADIGICMGSGADATRQSADVILTDDNMDHILIGIYQGRLMYDNLKKCICYVMTSQVQQFLPFLCLLTFRIPIPIFTLLVDAAVDFIPSVSFAFEQGQVGIMTRKPRYQQQHLVNAKLLAQCSVWMGLTQYLACFTCYWICMNDFGYQLGYLWGKSNIPTLIPLYSDQYNPTDPFFGNSNLAKIKTCDQFKSTADTLDWINAYKPWVDLRMSVVLCKQNSDGTIYFEQNMIFSQCKLQQISFYSGKPICYTTQATKYGQTSYMMGNVVAQVFNMYICKTRRDSIFTHGIGNKVFYFGIMFQYLLSIGLTQTSFMINLISTRDIIYLHYGLPAIPIGILQVLLDQLRKYLIRNVPRDNRGDQNRKYEDCIPNWWERNTLW